jgi:hypothetical protein
VVGCYHHGDYILFFFFFSLITYYAHLTHGSLAFWATNQQLPRSTASLLTSSSSSPLLTSSQHHLSANAHNHIRTKNLNTKNTGKCGVIVVQEQEAGVGFTSSCTLLLCTFLTFARDAVTNGRMYIYVLEGIKNALAKP